MERGIFVDHTLEIVSEQSKFEIQSHKLIRIKTNGGFIRILLSDILYIKSDLYLLDLYMNGGQTISHIGVLNDFIEKLDNLYFVQINRGLIINSLQIQKIVKKKGDRRRMIVMNNGEEFFVARRRWDKISTALEKIQ